MRPLVATTLRSGAAGRRRGGIPFHLAALTPTHPRTITCSSPSNTSSNPPPPPPPSLDALFQSPKLKANPGFARQVRKRVDGYRRVKQQQGAGTAPGRHPLAPREENEAGCTTTTTTTNEVEERPVRVIRQEGGLEIGLFPGYLVFTPPPPATTTTTTSGTLALPHPPPLPISYTHLRDSCSCPACIQPSTGQKLIKAGQAYDEVQQGWSGVPEVQVGMKNGEQGVTITWPSSATTTTTTATTTTTSSSIQSAHESGHSSFYTIPHLLRLSSLAAQPIEQTPLIHTPIEWPTRTDLLASPTLRIPYADFLHSRAAEHAFLAQLTGYGLVVLTGVPTQDGTDEGCELRQAMRRLGELRSTFYGKVWDVRALRREETRNIAYTDVDLGFHQDLCYFENPPRFQALHCLRNRVHGGSSYFTDSFAALRHMLTSHPDEYAVLKGDEGGDADVPFVYDNDGYWYYRTHRTVEEAPRAWSRSRSRSQSPNTSSNDAATDADAANDDPIQFHAVNYSPPFQAPFPPTQSPAKRDKLFRALATFERLLAREEGIYEFTLREGEMVVFDNRRVLHARRAFWDKTEAEEGKGDEAGQGQGERVRNGEPTRWLKGCYMDGDVVWNKMRVMNRLVRTGQVEPLPEWKEVLKRRGLLG